MWVVLAASEYGLGLNAQENALPPPIPAASAPHEAATQILHEAILQSVWGPPAYCVVRQSVHVSGKQLSGVGEFVRGGQGSGKLKFNLRIAAGDQLNTLLQVSDGQRLLSIEHIGDIRRRTEIDLGKVRPRLVLTSESLRDPVIALYLAIGGQAESLRKIYQQYEWYSVQEGRLGEVDVWWLRGKHAQQAPPIRSTAEVDNRVLLENNSGLLPSKVELAIGKQNASLPYWLYQVNQVRGAEELSPLGRSSGLRIVTEWASPVAIDPQQLTANIFEPPSSNEPLYDETERYLLPAPSVAATPRAAMNR